MMDHYLIIRVIKSYITRVTAEHFARRKNLPWTPLFCLVETHLRLVVLV
jgi:hypothetical protein